MNADERQNLFGRVEVLREEIKARLMEIAEKCLIYAEDINGYREGEPVVYNGKQALICYKLPEMGENLSTVVIPIRVQILNSNAGRSPTFRYVKEGDKLERPA